MESTNWLKQTADKPLFPDFIWSRPENRRQAGKLLIIGGNLHGFASPVSAYNAAIKAGIGTARVILPVALKRALGTSFKEADFAPSTPSGSFARLALDILLESAKWADGVLLAGDFGHNSETAVVLESFAKKYKGQVNFSGDSVDYFFQTDSPMLSRHSSVTTAELNKLQKLAKNNRPNTPILHSMNLHELVTVLADWSNSAPTLFVTNHADNFVVASGGKVSTTTFKKDGGWQVELAAYVSVWTIQNPLRTFEALTTAIFDYLNK